MVYLPFFAKSTESESNESWAFESSHFVSIRFCLTTMCMLTDTQRSVRPERFCHMQSTQRPHTKLQSVIQRQYLLGAKNQLLYFSGFFFFILCAHSIERILNARHLSDTTSAEANGARWQRQCHSTHSTYTQQWIVVDGECVPISSHSDDHKFQLRLSLAKTVSENNLQSSWMCNKKMALQSLSTYYKLARLCQWVCGPCDSGTISSCADAASLCLLGFYTRRLRILRSEIK